MPAAKRSSGWSRGSNWQTEMRSVQPGQDTSAVEVANVSARVRTIFTGRPWTSILPLSPLTTQKDIHWLAVRGVTSAYRRRRRAERASAHERGGPVFATEAPGVRLVVVYEER